MPVFSREDPDGITAPVAEPVCDHCGDPCGTGSVREGDRYFCCTGCRTVYSLLHDHELEDYYEIGSKPGLKPNQAAPGHRYAYLDDEKIRDGLLDFNDGSFSRITFSIPQIHCSACIWLLENLYNFHEGITSSRVNFARRELSVSFAPEKISLRRVVELLASIGYAPEIRVSDLEEKTVDRSFRQLYGRLALAGFCFGNVMLLSFPHYLGLDWLLKSSLGGVFDILKIILAIPVVFYSARDFFGPAWQGLRKRQINMDVPISIGITILFTRSLYEIIILGQPGYMDSLCALVFLLLIGRLYQKKTYRALSRKGDFRSFLPIAVIKKEDSRSVTIPIDNLKAGDRILIRNQELIPADGVLMEGNGHIDYSFVTGESSPVDLKVGQRLYAGGRQIGRAIELEIVKEPSQSYLMQLWSQTAGAVKEQPHLVSLATRISRIFTPAVLLIAVAAAVYWIPYDAARALNAATAVLIVACPCALALSTPFALGTAHRIFGRSDLYLKDSGVVERLAYITGVIFDKTGTITQSGAEALKFKGNNITDDEKRLVYSAVSQSTHPLSVRLANHLREYDSLPVNHFEEITGQGLRAFIKGREVLVGSRKWVCGKSDPETAGSGIYVSIDGSTLGSFRFANLFRKGLREVISSLRKEYSTALLSGDTDTEQQRLAGMFGDDAEMLFAQSPHDKLDFVHNRIMKGDKVLMVGDGINDAGALAAATVGITIMENEATFSPESDGILKAGHFRFLPRFIELSRDCATIIKVSFGLSFLYNAVGLFFAAQGTLSPLIAAVLMPASSVTVVLFVTAATVFRARQRGVL
jgi:Cu+-exporting ATPase